jgi:NAD(P)H-dependent FMN reductase
MPAPTTTPRLLAFGGSLRTGSFNRTLVQIAAEGARAAGAEVTLIALRDFALPVFNQDDENAHGLPEPARRLKQLFLDHHGFLIASPEYNSSVSGSLKNAIDWVSRSERPDEPPLAAFRGKTAALLSASPGALGGLRGLVHLRSLLENLGVLMLPDQLTLPKADTAFDANGVLINPHKQQATLLLGRKLTELTRRFI